MENTEKNSTLKQSQINQHKILKKTEIVFSCKTYSDKIVGVVLDRRIWKKILQFPPAVLQVYVSSCLFINLHRKDGALLCKHLKKSILYMTKCKTKHIIIIN